jgi:hypothetical protein
VRTQAPLTLLWFSHRAVSPTEVRMGPVRRTPTARCELSDGTCLYLRAKRTYGKDKTFKSAVEQWMAGDTAIQLAARRLRATARAGDVAADSVVTNSLCCLTTPPRVRTSTQ